MTRGWAKMLGALAVAAVLAGCGSSSSSPKSSSASPAATRPATSSTGASTSSFIASADAVCKAANAALAPVKTITGSTSNTAAQQIFQNAAGAFTVAINQLSALTPPPSLAGAWRAYLSDAKQEQTLISGMSDAIGAGDTASLTRDLHQAQQLSQHAIHVLAGKGFSHCGHGR